MTPYTFSLKHNKVKIADILASSGAIIQPVKTPTSKKSKPKKTKVDEEQSKTEFEEIKPKKFVLIKILDNGVKHALSPSEVEDLKNEYPDIAKLIEEPTALEEEEKNAPEEYIIY